MEGDDHRPRPTHLTIPSNLDQIEAMEAEIQQHSRLPSPSALDLEGVTSQVDYFFQPGPPNLLPSKPVALGEAVQRNPLFDELHRDLDKEMNFAHYSITLPQDPQGTTASIPVPWETDNIDLPQGSQDGTWEDALSILKSCGHIEAARLLSVIGRFINKMYQSPQAQEPVDDFWYSLDNGVIKVLDYFMITVTASMVLGGCELDRGHLMNIINHLLETSPVVAAVLAARFNVDISPGSFFHESAKRGFAAIILQSEQLAHIRDVIILPVVHKAVKEYFTFREKLFDFLLEKVKERHNCPDVAHNLHFLGALRNAIDLGSKCGGFLHQYGKAEWFKRNKLHWTQDEVNHGAIPNSEAYAMAIDLKKKGKDSIFHMRIVRHILIRLAVAFILNYFAKVAPIAVVRYLNMRNPFVYAQYTGPVFENLKYLSVVSVASGAVAWIISGLESKGDELTYQYISGSHHHEDMFQLKQRCTMEFIKLKATSGTEFEKADIIFMNGYAGYRGAEAVFPHTSVSAARDLAVAFGLEAMNPAIPPSFQEDFLSLIRETLQQGSEVPDAALRGLYEEAKALYAREKSRRKEEIPDDIYRALVGYVAQDMEKVVGRVAWGNMLPRMRFKGSYMYGLGPPGSAQVGVAPAEIE